MYPDTMCVLLKAPVFTKCIIYYNQLSVRIIFELHKYKIWQLVFSKMNKCVRIFLSMLCIDCRLKDYVLFFNIVFEPKWLFFVQKKQRGSTETVVRVMVYLTYTSIAVDGLGFRDLAAFSEWMSVFVKFQLGEWSSFDPLWMLVDSF